MAGIPMYYGIPTTNEVEAQMARDKMDVLKTKEAEIDLNDYIGAKEEMKKQALADLAKRMKLPPEFAPKTPAPEMPTTGTGFDGRPAEMPQGAISLAGAKSSNGTPMPSFMTGSGTETSMKEPSAPIEGYNQPQPQAEAPAPQPQQATPYQSAKLANQEYTAVNDQVNQAYSLAETFRQKGYLKEYQKQIKVAQDLETTRVGAQDKRIGTTAKLFEVTGQIAQGYLDTVANNPGASDQAWGFAAMQMNQVGVPADQLLKITDPRARQQIAESYANSSVSAINKLKLEQKALTEKNKMLRFDRAIEFKQDVQADKNRWEAEKRDIQNKKLTLDETKLRLGEAHKQFREAETLVKDKQAQIADLRSGKTLIDRNGELYTEDSRMAEVKALTEEINALQTKRQVTQEKIKAYGEGLSGADKKQVEEPNAPSPQDIRQVIDAINSSPDKIDLIKANWARLHPGVPFEDYIKVNTSEDTLKSFEGPTKRVKVDITKRPSDVEKMYQDPLTREFISQAEYRKKYGTNPK